MILPPATLGMLGGGQLGRFFVIAAHELGYRVVVLDPDVHSPAGALAERHLVAAFDDPDALNELGQTCAAVTTEFENVPADTLAYLSKFIPVHPGASCVEVAQNRIREKTFFRNHRLPVGDFAVIHSAEDLEQADSRLFPAVLKVARFGYDGKGQARVKDVAEAQSAFLAFHSEPCVLERLLSLEREVSVVLARAADGAAACFPVVENRHTHGILDVSIVPARLPEALLEEAGRLALGVASTLGYVGVLGVEMFVAEGRLLLNEIAPRPHNSGHYTLDACITSQFEQQVRVLCGLPLGEPRAHSAAVMVNLLGDLWRDGRPPHWSDILCEPNLRLHLYGKHHARAGRKMGHFTVIDSDADCCLETALAARQAIGITG